MVNRAWIALAGLAAVLAAPAEETARRAAPSYTAESVVNSGSYTTGPLATNTLGSIFGTDLAFGDPATAVPDGKGGLPNDLGGVRVYFGGLPAPLHYVSPKQINFIVPPLAFRPGTVKLWVVRQGVSGPQVDIAVTDAAPALFRTGTDSAIATHADYSLVNAESPARPGEVIVVYATGLGATDPALPTDGAPSLPLRIVRAADLRVLLDGKPVEAVRIQYAGVTPGWLGLYQVNLALPDVTNPNPEIRLVIGEQSSLPGLRLALR